MRPVLFLFFVGCNSSCVAAVLLALAEVSTPAHSANAVSFCSIFSYNQFILYISNRSDRWRTLYRSARDVMWFRNNSGCHIWGLY